MHDIRARDPFVVRMVGQESPEEFRGLPEIRFHERDMDPDTSTPEQRSTETWYNPAAIIVFVLLWRTGREFALSSVALALILGGALGNLYDRIRFHHVVDFLAVKIVHYNWPDFNVADSCIVIGACLLLLEIFRPIPKDS